MTIEVKVWCNSCSEFRIEMLSETTESNEASIISSLRANLFNGRKEKFYSISGDHHGEYMSGANRNLKMMSLYNVSVIISKDNKKIHIKGKVGDNLLFLCRLEGACEASLACTTCHCYVDFDYLSKLPIPEEREEDLLDVMAPFLKENSRYGNHILPL